MSGLGIIILIAVFVISSKIGRSADEKGKGKQGASKKQNTYKGQPVQVSGQPKPVTSAPVRPDSSQKVVLASPVKWKPDDFAPRDKEGRVNIAKRLELGDKIPENRRMAVCPYCGAENLVPAKDRSKYYCYFCHHGL